MVNDPTRAVVETPGLPYPNYTVLVARAPKHEPEPEPEHNGLDGCASLPVRSAAI